MWSHIKRLQIWNFYGLEIFSNSDFGVVVKEFTVYGRRMNKGSENISSRLSSNHNKFNEDKSVSLSGSHFYQWYDPNILWLLSYKMNELISAPTKKNPCYNPKIGYSHLWIMIEMTLLIKKGKISSICTDDSGIWDL